MNLIINDTDHPLIIKVASIQSVRMQVYFIDNEDYFQRKFVLTDEKGKYFDDNDERTIFFTRGVIETVRKLRWSPDIVHCHGWITALVPLYLKKAYSDDPLYSNSKVIYSVYNDGFDTPLNEKFSKKLIIEGITEQDVSLVKKPTYESLTRLALSMSDGIIIGDNNISKNILKYIKSAKKPILDYKSEEDYIDAYSGFYDEILAGC
jgi:starch synthase